MPKNTTPIRLSIWASGNGSNAENLAAHFLSSHDLKIAHVLTNNPSAGVIRRMGKFDIPVTVADNSLCAQADFLSQTMDEHEIDGIVLAGYLRLLPSGITTIFENRIINIHPALLPDFGGKGMYGNRVHEAVILAGKKESGITIHLVNEKYDDGRTLFQASCPLDSNDNTDSLAQKIHQLEYTHFPVQVEKYFREFFNRR